MYRCCRYMYTELSSADLQDLDWHSLAVRLPDAGLQDLDWYLLAVRLSTGTSIWRLRHRKGLVRWVFFRDRQQKKTTKRASSDAFKRHFFTYIIGPSTSTQGGRGAIKHIQIIIIILSCKTSQMGKEGRRRGGNIPSSRKEERPSERAQNPKTIAKP